MNTPESNWHKWERRVVAARADVPPPVNLASLLHVVRSASLERVTGWRAEWDALLTSQRLGTACLAGAACVALLGTWQVWTLWQLLPWVELAGGVGGAP